MCCKVCVVFGVMQRINGFVRGKFHFQLSEKHIDDIIKINHHTV